MRQRYDVVIVGGGLNGSSTAYHLASQPGFDGSVLVVERDPTYENAPSARASGGIRQQFSTRENVQIGLFGAHFVKTIDERLAVDGEPVGLVFRERGYCLLATAEALPLMQASHAVQREEGADIVFDDREALARRFPWLHCDGLAGGFFGRSNEGWVDPYGLLMAFRRKAISLGVDYVKDEAVDLERDGRRVTAVRLRGAGRVSAGRVVNTAGASGGRAIGRCAGVELPIESRLRNSFVFECREDLSGAPLTVLPDGTAWRPEGARYLVNLSPPPEKDPERHDIEIDFSLFEETIWPSLARWVPAFEAIKLVQSYACHYDLNTLDENLIIGLTPELDNFYVALGLSGHGMQQSPAVGRALYELIAFGEYRSIDLTRFGYQRVLTGEGIHETNCW
jgi:glycine/D-amino acid oxidase-like deaminating enzyme